MMLTGLIALALVAADTDPKVETIRLNSGAVVRGEILKEKPEAVVVDLGVDVISIPKREIASRSKGENTPISSVSPSEVIQKYGESGAMFATANLPQGNSVREMVTKFGEGVVMIKTPSGTGSGFIIDDEGHCITNYHVIEGETRITVDFFPLSGTSTSEKSVQDVEIVATSPFFDLALLKVPQTPGLKMKRVYFGFSDEVRQGEPSFAIGNPLGLTRTVTQGIISNRNRNVQGQLYLQTTTQINPGNSGGPLFNMRGQVIGVTNMRLIRGEGLAFAIPIDYVKDFLRNRDAYAYNKDNPNEGFRYINPPRRQRPEKPPFVKN
jgi:serine protease Do